MVSFKFQQSIMIYFSKKNTLKNEIFYLPHIFMHPILLFPIFIYGFLSFPANIPNICGEIFGQEL